MMNITLPVKSAFNACPVCGKPRGKGTNTEFSHGECLEKRAATEGKKPSGYGFPGKKEFTVEQREKAIQAERICLAGCLTDGARCIVNKWNEGD
jgi:hypothetical protein